MLKQLEIVNPKFVTWSNAEQNATASITVIDGEFYATLKVGEKEYRVRYQPYTDSQYKKFWYGITDVPLADTVELQEILYTTHANDNLNELQNELYNHNSWVSNAIFAHEMIQQQLFELTFNRKPPSSMDSVGFKELHTLLLDKVDIHSDAQYFTTNQQGEPDYFYFPHLECVIEINILAKRYFIVTHLTKEKSALDTIRRLIRRLPNKNWTSVDDYGIAKSLLPATRGDKNVCLYVMGKDKSQQGFITIDQVNFSNQELEPVENGNEAYIFETFDDAVAWQTKQDPLENQQWAILGV